MKITNFQPEILQIMASKIEEFAQYEEQLFSHVSLKSIGDVIENRIKLIKVDKTFQNLVHFVTFVTNTLPKFSKNLLMQKRFLRILGELAYLSLPFYAIVLADPISNILQHLQRNRDDGVRENAAINLTVILPKILVQNEEIPTILQNPLKYRILQSCCDHRAVPNIINQGLNQKSSNSSQLNNLCLEALHAFTVPLENEIHKKLQLEILRQLADNSLGVMATFRVQSFQFENLFKPTGDTAIFFMEIVRSTVEFDLISQPISLWEILDKFCKVDILLLAPTILHFECLINSSLKNANILNILKRKKFNRTLLDMVNKLPNKPEFTQHRGMCTKLARKII